MDEYLAVIKALSDPNRIRALLALRNGELCVCQIIELLSLAPSTVSKHMAILKQSGLVDSRKEERWMYYRIPASKEQTAIIKMALEFTSESLTLDPLIKNDENFIQNLIKTEPSNLCKIQRNRL